MTPHDPRDAAPGSVDRLLSAALDAAVRFFSALDESRWDDAAAMVDSDAVRKLHEGQLAQVIAWAQHRDLVRQAHETGKGLVSWSSSGKVDQALLHEYGATPIRAVSGVTTLAELGALSPFTFVARCLEITNHPGGSRGDALRAAKRRVLGGVLEGPSIVHALYRLEGPGITHTDPLHVDVLRLRKSDDAWRVDLTGFEFDIVSANGLMLFNDFLIETDDHPTPETPPDNAP